ncbi:FadR family transcriptional regulator [Ramlibacter sp. RBP-2]|uniref:FadR family transcriptional regulator n=1 Tax=Ramlibacter lithotrophicus TaxID=2606681 RepID=A0A7X6DG45_9BURK|nr:FadR/GntR family transcriptional regulator [Ramlibacter lithotrophicus]NKE66542.1 FadR family transcriptional regulator [Ramlibacter lithotrophicus]
MQTPAVRRPRSLTADLVQALGDRVRDGRWPAGSKLPTEGAIMAEFGVSRTVVREAISRLQAANVLETRHGIGTFVLGQGEATTFRIDTATLQDVIGVLELRIGMETEGAALAAMRRTAENLVAMRAALEAIGSAIRDGRDGAGADFQFHLEIARATRNPHFAQLMATLGGSMIPRARLDRTQPATAEREAYLRRVNAEHENILQAIERQDAEGARAAMRTHLANSKERRQRAAAQAVRRG